MICHSLYSQRLKESSTSHTNLLSFRFRTSFLVHLFTSPSFPDHVGICWSRFGRFSHVMVAFTGWHGALVFSRPNRKWLGVSAVNSSGSSLTAVRGLALRVCSTRHIVVLSSSSVRLRLSKNCNHDFPAILNQSFPDSTKVWGSSCIEFPNNLFLSKSPSILALSHSFMNAFSSLAAPTKYVPLSLMMVPG